jgi:hypothetical protein
MRFNHYLVAKRFRRITTLIQILEGQGITGDGDGPYGRVRAASTWTGRAQCLSPFRRHVTPFFAIA